MMNIQEGIGNNGLIERILEKKTGLLMSLFSRARYFLALGIPKPKSFSDTDRKILIDAGFAIVES